TATFTVEDTQDPFWDQVPTDLIVVCDGNGNTGDIGAWVGSFGNGAAADNCTAVGDLIITDDYDGSPPEDCGLAGVETVTFTVEDECGNTTEWEADIIIEDFDPPTISGLVTNPATTECDTEGPTVQDMIDGIVAAASATDFNNCTDPDDLIWEVLPIGDAPLFPTTPDPNCVGETFAGEYEFEVTVIDDCGNLSVTETVIITIEDTTPPQLPGNLPPDVTYDCASDIPDPPDLILVDPCSPGVPVFNETILFENCPNQIEIEREWIFEDACLNSAGTHTQLITVDDQSGPEWLGDTEDYLPSDIEILVADCSFGYMFPNGYFENEETGDAWPDFPLLDGVHFEDLCPNSTFMAFPPPNEEFGEGETEVVYTVTDECGNTLTHTFIVNILCSNCDGGGLFCGECETSIDDGCFTCNIGELLDGFNSCTPEYMQGGGTQPSQPSPLCNGQGVPHNMSWFAFVAGGTDLCVTVQPFQCAMGTGAIGLQSGVYDFCEDEGGECLGGQATCSNGLDAIEYEVNELVVGNTYYLFVDGCNGAECDYEIEIEKGYEFVIDTPDEVVVEASCEQAPSFPPLTYCPETVLQFNIHHFGDSPSDMGAYDGPGPYAPDLNATFFWTFDPPIEGLDGGEWNQIEDDYNIPPLTFTDVLVPTEFTVCLTDIVAECDDQSCDDCCLTFTIQPLPDELYGPYDVCVEDLLAPGWDPGIVGEDPNGDGIPWIGPNQITLDMVQMAENGILDFDVIDPDCMCPFVQSVQINPIGNLDPQPVTLYMFDCQFRDEDYDPEQYEWFWPSQVFDLDGDELEELFNIEMASQEIDWDEERCDSLILVTVDTTTVDGDLFAGPCTPSGTQYWFELALEELEDLHPDHPEINPNYIIEWIDANTMQTVATGDTINIDDVNINQGMYIVQVEYFFFDGAYGDDAAITVSCVKQWGPFDLESGTATPPDFLRMDTVFCVNDLENKLFVVNPFQGSTFEWTFPTGADGVVTGAVSDTATVDFTNYDFNANQPITVLANTICGQSPAVEIYVRANPLPEPMIDAPLEVCVNELAEANFMGDQSEIASYAWSSTNYISGNQSGPGPVSYSSSTPGTIDIELVVIDNNGCESLPVSRTVNVIEELDAPMPDCSTTSTSITFTWPPVTGATGYTINVLDSPSGTSTIINTDAETSVMFDMLDVLDEVEIEIIANGPPPCGDSAPANIRCQAQDCPDPQWVFNLWADTSYCENAPIAAFNFDVAANDDGVASYVGNGVSPTGLFDPSDPSVVVGDNIITMTYTYQNGNCTRSQTRTITVYPTPRVDFTVSDNEICLGESITIDDTNVDQVANWNGYDGGTINAQNEISWDTPGLKTIVLDVTAPDNLGNCTNQNTAQVMVLDTVIMGPVTCIDQDLDFVQFEWAPAFSATGYDITYTVNQDPPVTLTQAGTDITIDMLTPGDEVTITVTALSANSCPNVSSSSSCIAVECIPLVMAPITCAETGIDYVIFEWQAVNGASTFDVYINGMLVGNQDSLTFFVDGLSPGDNVDIQVDAINDLGPCPGTSRSTTCTAIDCPPVDVTFGNTGPHCWEAGATPIQLEASYTGGQGNGTITWNSPFVDQNTGIFTPDDNMDMTYNIGITITEPGCTYTDAVDIEVNIIPVASIEVSDDDICVSETTMVISPFAANNSETPIWDFGAANVISGSGFGPYELSWDNAGDYDISLSIDNAGCVSEVETTTVQVDAELIPTVISCGATDNSSVTFEWTPVTDVTQYVVSINSTQVATQTETTYTVTGLSEGEDAEITLEFLTASSCSLAPQTFICTANACPDSYFEIAAYDREMCLDGTQTTQQLNITLLDPPAGNGNGTWSGQGISPNGLFNPNGLAAQSDIPLTYTIEFAECTYDTTVLMTLHEAPRFVTVNPINPNCFEDNNDGGQVEAIVEGGTPDYQYQVDNGPQQGSSIFMPVSVGLHEMLVTDANGCTSVVSFDIIAAIDPDLSINGPLQILNSETGEYSLSTNAQNIGDVIWLANGVVICQGLDCDPVTILGADYPNDFELTVQIFFDEDCFKETTIRVDVFDIQKWYIPNVIVPTSQTDNANTNFVMWTKGTGITVSSVDIFDRWGEKVYTLDAIDSEQDGESVKWFLNWDGAWGDSDGLVEDGVYVYLIEMEVEGRKVVEVGDLTVIR
ncbi:MAG: hypothetical protein HKN09_05100, partial [Saprospiraceae bacterium]|nr:hypothetical protein [Saprospiraceae bacterium]